MTHYDNQLKISTRAQKAAAYIDDHKTESKHNQECKNYQKLISMDMLKIWVGNKVN